MNKITLNHYLEKVNTVFSPKQQTKEILSGQKQAENW